MILLDALLWLAIAKCVVLLLEDGVAAAKGQRSPRLKERDRQKEAAGGADAAAPSGAGGRMKAAFGGYLAGLAEDAADGARASRRRKRARKAGKRAIDGVLVDVDEDAQGQLRFYADCDLCDWSSRGYAIEQHAREAGTVHAATHRPETADPEPTGPGPSGPGGESSTGGTGPGPTGDGGPSDGTSDSEAPRPPKLTVIPGGAADPQPDPAEPVATPDPAGEAPPAPSGRDWFGKDHPDAWDQDGTADPTQRLTCAVCRYADLRPAHARRRLDGAPICVPCYNSPLIPCAECGNEVSPAGVHVRAADGAQVCRFCLLGAHPGDERASFYWGCNRCGTRHDGFATREAAQADAAGHECPVAEPDTDDAGPESKHFAGCDRCNWTSPAFDTQAEALAAGQDHVRTHEHAQNSPDPAAPVVPAEPQTAGSSPVAGTAPRREFSMNLDATGPEEIRGAFSAAIETADTHSEEIGGVGTVLSEAADRYESLQMAATTVGHLTDAADKVKAAAAALTDAKESLESALADFNARDGQVAEAVGDAGNLAGSEVLVG